MQSFFYIIEIILSLVGIGVILMQQHSEEGSSFLASSTQTFKLQTTRDKVLFILTLVIIFMFIGVLILHKRVVS